MTTITVYTKNDCPRCHTTKRWLTKHGVPFIETNIDDEENKHLYDELKANGILAMPFVKAEFPDKTVTVEGFDKESLDSIETLYARYNPDARPPMSLDDIIASLKAGQPISCPQCGHETMTIGVDTAIEIDGDVIRSSARLACPKCGHAMTVMATRKISISLSDIEFSIDG